MATLSVPTGYWDHKKRRNWITSELDALYKKAKEEVYGSIFQGKYQILKYLDDKICTTWEGREMFLIFANNNKFAKLKIQPQNSVLDSNNLGLETNKGICYSGNCCNVPIP